MSDITLGALHLAIQITGCRDEAKDILQSALTKALEHKRSPKPGDTGYKAWLYKVVHNASIDWLRSRKHLADAVEVPEEVVDEDPGTELDRDRRKLLLHMALNRLTSEQREIICLKDFHDLSYEDIAKVISVEKGTVMSRLHRARMALKQELINLNIFPGDDNEL